MPPRAGVERPARGIGLGSPCRQDAGAGRRPNPQPGRLRHDNGPRLLLRPSVRTSLATRIPRTHSGLCQRAGGMGAAGLRNNLPGLTPSHLAGTMQLNQSRLLDLFARMLCRSPLTDRLRICSRLTPRTAQTSAAQSLSSQLHRPGLGARPQSRWL